MGLPAIQVVMIIARQLSRPIADWIMRLGKDHPGFRNKFLIPTGRRLAHLTTRVRMTNLGLGAPTSVAPVSEAAALEQASEFLQQVTIFIYMVGVASAYHFYTKATAKDYIEQEQFEEFKQEIDRRFMEIDDKIDQIVHQKGIKLKPYIPPPPPVKEVPTETPRNDSLFSSISLGILNLDALKKLLPIKSTQEVPKEQNESQEPMPVEMNKKS
uniref:OPA3-like protein n=1 Tax=Acrobeloides nanus TaxID=290746 RepID=A0A914E0P1_9BILA